MCLHRYESIAHFLKYNKGSHSISEIIQKTEFGVSHTQVRRELDDLVSNGFASYFTHNGTRYYSWR